MTKTERLNKYFEFKCRKGLKSKNLDHKQEYQDRLEYELSVILPTPYPPYFLIVANFVDWCHKHNILVGPGRGSGAGSLITYSLGITNIDPIKYGLIFERFFNPERISMPDLDIDFQDDRRDEVIDYVREKYGEDHVAQIGTFGKMLARGAIRDVTKVLGLEYTLGDSLAKATLEPVHGKPPSLQKSLTDSVDLKKAILQPGAQEIIDHALLIEGFNRSIGVHASGTIISKEPLADLVPLYRDKSGNRTTTFDMNILEELGLIKFDFLGLRTLSIIAACINLIHQRHGIKINIDTISLEDEDVYQMLCHGDTCGVFQLESSGMVDLLTAIQPHCLEDIIVLVAAYRPGPLGSNGLKQYLAVRKGKCSPTYVLPALEPVLEDTSGWMIYQEQIMRICTDICQWTGGEADTMRTAIGKKKEDIMASLRPKFIQDLRTHAGASEDIAQKLYEDIEDFASYSFNKAHAACYGLIGYQTAWLKHYYPLEYLCACLQCEGNDPDNAQKYMVDCRSHNIDVLPPSINESGHTFTITTDKRIRFGLAAVKNLGIEPVSFITDARKNGEFTGLLDFTERVDLGKINRRKLESLILSGAFDGLESSRQAMLDTVEEFWDYRKESKKYESKLETFNKKTLAFQEREKYREVCEEFSDAPDHDEALGNTIEIFGWEADRTATGRLKKKLPLKLPVMPTQPVAPVINPETEEMEESERYQHEFELLGLYISGHPLDKYRNAVRYNSSMRIDTIKPTEHGNFIRVSGVITKTQLLLTKKKKQMVIFTLQDQSGSVNIVVFPNIYKKLKNTYVDGDIICAGGRVEVSANSSKVQVNAIQLEALEPDSEPYKTTEVETLRLNTDDKINTEELNRLQERNVPTNIVIQSKDGTKFLLQVR